MHGQVLDKDMIFLSIIVTNIVVVEIEEEDTEVANYSIAEVVDMKDNRVEIVVESLNMLVGL